MPQQVVTGAMATCSFGAGPGSLVFLPANRVNANRVPAANIMDNIPMVNVMPFVMCSSLANPTVASATAAASGVLTPMPCIPNTVAPWSPGSATVKVGGMAALTNVCTLNCIWGGMITISNAGQVTVNTA